jgi:hypothetical protein
MDSMPGFASHEFDHVNGVCTQQISAMTNFGFVEALFPQSDLAVLAGN